jgi:phosphatidylglycerol:prolipoprotein diacylglycerol transferase
MPPEFSGLLTYFLIISLALCLCLIWLVKRADQASLSRNTALDLCLVLMSAGFLGARLLHVVYEAPQHYLASPLRVFEIWRGGFVWYGGLICGALAALAFLRLKREPLGAWLDLFAPVLALGYGLGRIACWLTGCCYGRLCLVAGVQFRAPTQALAVFWELAVMVALLKLAACRESPRFKSWLRPPGQIFFVWVVLHAVGRVLMESLRGDDRGATIGGLSLATWLSAVFAFIGLCALLRQRSLSAATSPRTKSS